ncbi:flagellar export chaperone FliS [Halalkalibacter akibai]|uniref:Flagellar secretion chaperone FliS n=1 Tax=Halalkalibacter akibai (strain ATCC 43226 / DSM 21942 / CIP 109018 / JCM 9157 / 1139) TaxID=1236973 RepID=W4QN51_HALA3|nr:flagellar export chaperone FliS [Halalkalibacter akibai]GAE33501.1 flagellar biosynthesis protein FliS [Halalkalibacter akibai JCM 9157]
MTTFLTNEALHQKTSQELTSLLYEACLTNLETAIIEINNKNFIEVNEKLKKAIDIIHRLGSGLNYEAGIIADQLDQVYNYIADKIIEANFTKDASIIEEVIKLVTMLMSSWNEAMKTKRDSLTQATKRKALAYESSSVYE